MDALKYHRDALAIIDHLAKTEPGNQDRQHDLYLAYEMVGALLLSQGDRPGALIAFRAGQSSAEALAVLDPADADRQGDLRDAYEYLGGTLVGQGDLVAALDAFNDAKRLTDGLLLFDPGSTRTQHNLSVILNGIGDARVALGDLGGLQSYRDALAIIERLIQSDPDNAALRQDALLANWRLATHDDDAPRRWRLIVASLHETAARTKLNDRQASWLATAELQVARLPPGK